MSMEFLWGLTIGVFLMIFGAGMAIVVISHCHEEDDENLEQVLSQAIEFLVLYHLQPDHVNDDEVRSFLESLGELEENPT